MRGVHFILSYVPSEGIEVTVPIGLALLSQMYILIQKVVLVCSGCHTNVSSKSCFITVNGSDSQ